MLGVTLDQHADQRPPRGSIAVAKRKRPPGVMLYPEDLITGTMLMTDAEFGTYVRLLCQQVILGGELPSSQARLAKISFVSRRRLASHWPALANKFEESETGGLYNARMRSEIERAADAATVNERRARKAARARWDALSNAPSMPEALLEQCHPDPDPDPEEEKTPPQKGRDPNPADQGPGVRALPRRAVIPASLVEAIPDFPALWAERLRCASRRPTISAEEYQLSNAAAWLQKHGVDFVLEAVKASTENGWQGFFEPKRNGNRRPHGTKGAAKGVDYDEEKWIAEHGHELPSEDEIPF